MSHQAGSYDESTWSDDLAQAIAAQRRQVRQVGELRRQKIDELHVRLEQQLRELEKTITRPSGPVLEQLLELESELDERRQQLDERELRMLEEHETWQERLDQATQAAAGCTALRAELDAQQAQLDHEREELEELQSRTKQQRRRLADEIREQRTERRPPPANSNELSQLQAKYDMALGDLRDMRRRNAELESRGSMPLPSKAESGNFDWESQKRRMIDAMEHEVESGDPITDDRAEERLTIEATIRITDQVVADKDREIAKLNEQLKSPTAHSVAAAEQLLAQDEIVQQERQRLAELRAEWETKCRSGEVQLSQERAKLARDRAEVEELRQGIPSQPSNSNDSNADVNKPKKPAGGRWLSRLGLSNDE